MNYNRFLLLFSIIIFFNSCSEDTDCCPMPEPVAEFDSGIFVLNEGNFGSGNASVSFFSEDMSQVQTGVFLNINGNELGDTAQSIELHEDLAIIVINVSNKIEIVNRYTFERLGTINTQLQYPRYAEVLGEKIYVTNWGDGMNPDDDFVAVFDLSDFSFIRSIAVDEGPEKILGTNEKLFVAHKGGFSFNNLVSVVNANSNEVETEIEVGDIPNSMILNGNDLWVLAGGKPSYADTETAGRLTNIDINNNQVKNEFEFLVNTVHPGNLSFDGNTAYLTIGKNLYEYNLDNMQSTLEFEMEEPAMLYGFEIHEGKIYVASPNADFTGNGTLYIYELSTGDLIDQVTTGINPNGIYFN